jgi:2-hydroxychromene-2-carboxylate isomerase
MAAPIGFYFDFLSPYGYLGAEGVTQVAARTGRRVEWRPMLLGVTVLRIMGLKAVPDTPMKGAYAAHDWPRFARYMDLPAAPQAATDFASLPAMRAFVWMAGHDRELAQTFGRAVFAAHWGEGREIGTPQAVASHAARLGVSAADCLAAIDSEETKTQLREQVDKSIAAGVFGCPTFEVGGELFWGADRLSQVEDWIRTGGW